MNAPVPQTPWQAWQTPPPSARFDAGVWARLEQSRASGALDPIPWWERAALVSALAGAAAVLLLSLRLAVPARPDAPFAAITDTSLTHAYAVVLRGDRP